MISLYIHGKLILTTVMEDVYMKRTNGYRILFYLVNTLFWFNIFVAGFTACVIIYFHYDDSILQNTSFNVSLGKGLVDVNMHEYPDTKLIQLLIVASFISCILSSAMLWNFKVLFKNAAKGSIFVSSNTKAIFAMGIIFLIGSFAAGVPKFFIAAKLAPLLNVKHGTITISYSIDGILFIAAVFILLLGAFFKKAVAIAQENELTI
ncbi:DUF2975 domain-containing protein [Priestia megaterium]|nr:DUF2975 domain-containing protein [Priestia megaterium]